jgi:hypothetical protein
MRLPGPSSASTASSRASSPGAATVIAPRGRSSFASVKPGGGSTKKAWLAALIRCTTGGP